MQLYACRCTVCDKRFLSRRPGSDVCLRCLFTRNLGPVQLTGCRDWQGCIAKKGGYGLVSFGKKQYKAHRVAWLLAYGELPKLFVCHKCDRPICIAIEHLFLGTAQDNMADRDSKRRQPHGERNGSAKLSWKDVLEIRQKFQDGATRYEIASHYNVHYSAVCRVISERCWNNK